jgi:hypothetical protein
MTKHVLFCFILLQILASAQACKKKQTSQSKSVGGATLLQKCTLPPDGSSKLPKPSSMQPTEFQQKVFQFLSRHEYQKIKGWLPDKAVRDTGPGISGQTYKGTHPAVKIWYSPGILQWMKDGRSKCIPDGSMIIKEMYTPPAALYAGKQLPPATLWTYMIKDGEGSRDGWYWGYYDANPGGKGTPQPVDSHAFPFHYPENGFGQYCVRCHASANKELTFVHEANIQGFPGTPLNYNAVPIQARNGLRLTDDGQELPIHGPRPGPEGVTGFALNEHDATSHANRNQQTAFVTTFPFGNLNNLNTNQFKLPGMTHDRVVANGKIPQQYATSDQCLSCHDADMSPFGPNLVTQDPDTNGLKNVSPYGEWRWSMMGLAGRDPIFFAQLESETTRLANATSGITPKVLEHTCLNCHGAMGQKQFTLDHPGKNFDLQMVHKDNNFNDPMAKYGALARDGISCMICHQMKDNSNKKLIDIATGKFEVAEIVNNQNQIYGPREKPVEHIMTESLGMKPVHSTFIQKSRVCATCHNVHLPVVDPSGKIIKSGYEQSTYLEWDNSAFRDGQPTQKSCQDCHMPTQYRGKQINGKIANVEDQDFPDYRPDFQSHLKGIFAPVEKINVKVRENVRRHSLNGINVFALMMFDQFDDILGIRKTSYMSGINDGLQSAIRNNNHMAKTETAQVVFASAPTATATGIQTRIKVINRAGHRFPSGVGFRRAFLEVKVTNSSGQLVWASGITNPAGVIVDRAGNVLPTEFRQDTGKYQPHHQVINNESQVQIYEEVVKGLDGKFTTSFLNLAHHEKDNRLLPQGWNKAGAPGFDAEQVKATQPTLGENQDPDFVDGSGSDTITYNMNIPGGATAGLTVSAQLYYQSIPPSYLKDRFTGANGPATQRLYYITSRLNTQGTPIENWKLLIASANAPVN